MQMQTATIGHEVLPVQQPLLLSGGTIPPLNVFHNPIWMNQNKPEQQPLDLQHLSQLNQQLDDQLYKLNPMMQQQQQQSIYLNIDYPKFMQTNNDQFPPINGLEKDQRFRENLPDFTKQNNMPSCVRREGMLKIRDVDQKDKDVVVTYAILTKDRLSYFVNSKDESSIQGSIELAKIKESIKLINGFATCFTVKTIDGVSDCSICAESEDSAREWINAITQNIVNCNTVNAVNNLNKRGLLK